MALPINPFDLIFKWPSAPGCRWSQGHDVRLGLFAWHQVNVLLRAGKNDAAERMLDALLNGVRAGLWCVRCGLSMAELIRWPLAQCLPRPRVAGRYLPPGCARPLPPGLRT
jgi:hypothetical protein